MTKEVTGVAEIGTAKDERVAQYARFILALNLQHIQDILDNSWAFSIALAYGSRSVPPRFGSSGCTLHRMEDYADFNLNGGDPQMTSHIGEVTTLFKQAAFPGFYRIWCGSHQLDLKLRSFYEDLRKFF
ncbi:unnamed protein product [Hyaloperonospora brassicae]|uniref:Uncharacterized protein n=1 Tax=Hyaloperonospora brassicae TaxID=162125 RepID=A0AAV0TPN3_HYABA|nr:unnamed protein product [Hyaloperonospora brassicae]